MLNVSRACISSSPLFCLPSIGFVKVLLEFLIQHSSSTISKKVSFHTVRYSSLLVMISSSLITCMCTLFFARKKYVISHQAVWRSNVSSFFLIKWFNDYDLSNLISLWFLGVKLSKEIWKAFQISLNSEAAFQMCYYKKVFWKYAENLQDNIRSEVRFQ